MSEAQDWRTVYDFWFPPGLDDADPEAHRRMFGRWFGGGANAELPPFAPVVEAARAGCLGHWLATPLGRLALIVVLDQFPRGLFAGTPAAYASDPDAGFTHQLRRPLMDDGAGCFPFGATGDE